MRRKPRMTVYEAVRVLDLWLLAGPRRRWVARPAETGQGLCSLEHWDGQQWTPSGVGPADLSARITYGGATLAAARIAAAKACLKADPKLRRQVARASKRRASGGT